METVTLPEQYSERIETITGYQVRITSYPALDRMGEWLARAGESTQSGTETTVMAKDPETTFKMRVRFGGRSRRKAFVIVNVHVGKSPGVATALRRIDDVKSARA